MIVAEPATGRNAGAVLEVEHLETEFHLRAATVRAVNDVSFTVREGECVGLVGESGCGKTTAALSIMKLLPDVGHVTGGSIKLLGRELLTQSDDEMRQVRGDDVAMIFQDPMTSLNPTWTIGRQIAEPVLLHREATKKEARQRALEVLDLVGMPRPEERLDAYPHQLSGGLRQRVMIAIALACEPKLLIADEPTTALDVTIQAQILDLIDELRERLRMAVLLITHDMGVIAARAQRVMVMYAGKIAEAADTDELFARMRHPYSEALLSAIPRLDQDRTQRLYSIPGLPPDLTAVVTSCRFAPRCRYATDRCRSEDPPLVPDTEGSRSGEHLSPASTRSVSPTPSRACTRAEARPAGPAQAQRDVVLEVEHLEKEFPVTAGAILQRKVGSVKAVSDVSFKVRAGRDVRPRRRVRLRQDHDRLARRRARPPDAGRDSLRGRGDLAAGRPGVAAPAPRSAADVPGPVRLARPTDARRRRRSASRSRSKGIGSRRDQRARTAELLAEVGLSPNAAGLYPHEFSGGQRQRIGLARALALNPKLIVADEPVSALDVSIQAQILNLMRTLQEAHGLTYIVISHDLAVVRYLADTIGVMYLGKLVEIGPAGAVYEHAGAPVHPRPDRRDPRARSRGGTQPAGRGGPRRAAVGDLAAVRLPLPHPLPVRTGDLRRSRSRRSARSARSTSRPATSRSRLPDRSAQRSAAAPRTRRAARRRRS